MGGNVFVVNSENNRFFFNRFLKLPFKLGICKIKLLNSVIRFK